MFGGLLTPIAAVLQIGLDVAYFPNERANGKGTNDHHGAAAGESCFCNCHHFFNGAANAQENDAKPSGFHEGFLYSDVDGFSEKGAQ